MSHPVFLNASSFPRMPNGEAGEWRSFWEDGKEELEAKYGIPVFWWCLFGSGDLKSARLIDDEDIGAEDRDDAIGDEALTYPYLVTSQEEGLQRLKKRKDQVLAAIGQEHAPAYDAFVDLIERCFGPFLLVRTSGLPDVEAAEPWMSEIAAEMDALDAGAPIGPELRDMADQIRRRQGSDAIWRLAGSGDEDVWPPPELIPPAVAVASGAAGKPSRDRSRFKESLVEWLAGLVIAGSTLGAYLWTDSTLAGVLAFVASATIVVWWIIRVRR